MPDHFNPPALSKPVDEDLGDAMEQQATLMQFMHKGARVGGDGK